MSVRATSLALDGGRLYLREVGTGRPIIVLHGGPDLNHEYFLPELDALADLGRLVYYDQRGRGRSFTGEDAGDITIESEMADLDRVRSRIGAEQVALLGHSWGVLLALEYATRHPERVSHLVLMNSAPASHADMRELRRHFEAIRPPKLRARMAELAADPAFRAGDATVEAEYYQLHFASALARPEHRDEIVTRLRRGFSPEGILAARAIEERLYEVTWLREAYDLHPLLRDLHIPSLVLHGDHDFIPGAIARRIAEAIPGSRLLILPECGHFAFLEQPDAVHRAVAELLA